MLGQNTLFPPKDPLSIFSTIRMGESHSNKAAFFLRNERERISFYPATSPFYFSESIAVSGKAIRDFQNNILLFPLQRRMQVSFALYASLFKDKPCVLYRNILEK